mmetsp:Transcript_67077/g.160788  ORF Transcript_67077/g.160788 Transcript_67077/m.160788 type:complete len:89 (-) Transcript_67077:112-378(-)
MAEAEPVLPPEERSRAGDCGYFILDLCACLTRGTVSAGRATYQTTARVAYPIKEAGVSAFDNTSVYFNPSQQRRPMQTGVASFSGSAF